MLNVVAIMGRLVADPELRTTQSGTNVCSFRIACDRNFARQGEQRQADFIDIVAWRQQADFVTRYFGKGRMILVEGELQTRSYTDKNGMNVRVTEVIADRLCFTGEKAQNGSYGDYAASVPNAAPAAPANAPQQSAPAQAPAADFSGASGDPYPF